jgi:hypothetical protein
MPTHHSYSFGDTGSHHVAYGCPSEIVKDLTRKSSRLASPMPYAVILGDPLPLFMEHKRDNLPGFSLNG